MLLSSCPPCSEDKGSRNKQNGMMMPIQHLMIHITTSVPTRQFSGCSNYIMTWQIIIRTKRQLFFLQKKVLHGPKNCVLEKKCFLQLMLYKPRVYLNSNVYDVIWNQCQTNQTALTLNGLSKQFWKKYTYNTFKTKLPRKTLKPIEQIDFVYATLIFVSVI